MKFGKEGICLISATNELHRTGPTILNACAFLKCMWLKYRVYQSNTWNQIHLLTCPLVTTAAASSFYCVCSHEHPWDLLYTCDGEDPGFFYPLTPQVAGKVKELCGKTLEQGYSQGGAHRREEEEEFGFDIPLYHYPKESQSG